MENQRKGRMSESGETPKDAKARAKAEKAYQKASRPWYKKKRFISLGVIALIGIGSALSGGGGSDTSSSSSTNQSSTETEAEAPAVEVTAQQLLSELENNALSAKNNWKDKRIKLTGTLYNIDASGDYFSLRGDDEYSFINVQVYIDDSLVDTVSAFKKGQEVTVTGVVSDVGEVLGYSVKAQSIP